MFPDCATIAVKVKVKLPAGVHLKLLLADILNEPSLSVVIVPTAPPVTVTPFAVVTILAELLC